MNPIKKQGSFMNKGRLSYFSAAVLGLLGVFFLISLISSYYWTSNGTGDFLKESFSYPSFFIPLYILGAAFLSLKRKFLTRWVILQTSTIIPFLTLVIFWKVYFDIDNTLPVKIIVNTFGRKEGAFLLFLIFLVEILLIYILSIRKHNTDTLPSEEFIHDEILDDKIDSDTESESYLDSSILTPGISTELLGTKLVEIPEARLEEIPEDDNTDILEEQKSFEESEIPGSISFDHSGITEVDLPELPSLSDLRSIKNSISESDTPEDQQKDKDLFLKYGEGDIEPDDESGKLETSKEVLETIDSDDYEEEVFSEIGEDHLVNTEIPEPDFSGKEEDRPKVQKKFTYANYEVPSENILNDYADGLYWVIDDATRHAAEVLRETLEEFKIKAEVTGIKKGPVITMFEILPAPGVKLSKIANLADNIAMRLAASRIRIVAPIPGKHAVGIEIPNKERAKVSFKEMLQDDKFQDTKTEIPIAIGKDITGNTQIIDLVKTPHLLIAGATGSGKSVCVNSLICSILYKRNPDEVKLLLIDPKIVELKLYNGIPHLLTPVITEPKRAFQALQYCIYIMEQRYALLDSMGVRDIRSYNKKIIRNRIATKKLPYIVVIVDEFADLIATSGKELESILARLAAMARAVGIHLVLATQRPSIDVITGLIKANIPSRIAFMVSNKIDSRIILDTAGADKLLGQGDMLFSSAWDPSLTRIQGAFLSDAEVEAVTAHVKTLGEPDYIDEEIFYDDDNDETSDNGNYHTNDPLMDKAIETVVTAGKASASYLQRRLQIGYNRAARIVEDMEARGIVGPPNGSKPREILHVPDRVREIPADN
jgi:DNA segregation ATPase FtsK/SpoIIIE, S-DNA-T family